MGILGSSIPSIGAITGGNMGAISPPNGPAGGSSPVISWNPSNWGNFGSSVGQNAADLNPFGNSDNWGKSIAGLNPFKGPGTPQLQPIAAPANPQMDTKQVAAMPDSMSAAHVGPYNTMSSYGGMVMGAGGGPGGSGAQQNALSQLLMKQASGQGPSIAGMQAQQAMGQNIAGQFAMANSARGGQQGLALRDAMTNSGNMNANVGMQSALGRLAEQQQAAGTLGNVLQGQRGQDLQQATTAAQLNQGASQFNAGNSFQGAMANAGFQQGANQTNFGGALQTNMLNANLGQQAQVANQNAGLAYQNQLMQATEASNNELLQMYGIQNQAHGQALSAGGSALGALASLFGGNGGLGSLFGGAAAGGGGMAGGDAADAAAEVGNIG
jgi:hypothetical protein